MPPRSSSSTGTAARRTRARSPTCARAGDGRASIPATIRGRARSPPTRRRRARGLHGLADDPRRRPRPRRRRATSRSGSPAASTAAATAASPPRPTPTTCATRCAPRCKEPRHEPRRSATRAPSFALPDTAGAAHSPGGDAATVVVFTCNHCPYALAWHDRLPPSPRDYAAARRADAARSTATTPSATRATRREAMAERVAAEPEAWPMPYLHDATQEVARAYGARTTPDVFVLDADGRLRYRGAPDADHDDPSLDAAWLRAALDAVLAGRPSRCAETEPVGCSIKWQGVERVASRARLGELALEHLAGRVARQLVDEHDLARDLEAREVRLHVVLQLGLAAALAPGRHDDTRAAAGPTRRRGRRRRRPRRRVGGRRAGPRPRAGRRSRRRRRSSRRRGRRRTAARRRRSGRRRRSTSGRR